MSFKTILLIITMAVIIQFFIDQRLEEGPSTRGIYSHRKGPDKKRYSFLKVVEEE